MGLSTHVHQVLLHVVGEVLQHGHLAHKVFGNLAGREDGALAQLSVVVDGSGRTGEVKLTTPIYTS